MGQTFEHVLHIGAGLCTQLPEYHAAGASSITLFEPDPETAALLRAQTADCPEVLVVEAAVGTGPASQKLHRFSFADLNSLRTPTGLNGLFPALEALEECPVQVQNPVDLVCGLQLSETGAHMLVLDAPGEALSILMALDDAGILLSFRQLRISEGREALYEGATPLPKIRSWLEGRHFSKNPQWDSSDPDRPVLTVTYDSAAAKQAHLEKRLAEARKATDETEQRLKTLQLENAQELAELQQELVDLRLENESKAEASAAQFVSQIKNVEHSLTMSLRIQSLREADLKDLQNRYKKLLGEKDAQGELLGRLTSSLKNAALYLQDIEETPVERVLPKPPSRKKPAPRKAKKPATSDE